MAKNLAEAPVKAPSRKLGDHWEGWNGEVEENRGDLGTNAWFFMLCLGAATLVVTAGGGLSYYLVQPRLREISPWLDLGLLVAAGAAAVAVWSYYLLLLVALTTGHNLLAVISRRHLANGWLVPLAFRVGRAVGLSEDRIRNSLLQAGNALVVAGNPAAVQETLLIILPRCMHLTIREQLRSLAGRYGVRLFTAAGGNVARRIIAEQRPQAIIAVACERDLVSGVQEVGNHIPVIALANKRPEGPCQNTLVDLSDLERAIRLFLHLDDPRGRKIDQPTIGG